MATYSKAPYISAAVAASGNNSSTIYTCPANSYAMLNALSYGGNQEATVGGKIILVGTSVINIYVGPGQAVVADTTSTGNALHISGVVLTNS